MGERDPSSFLFSLFSFSLELTTFIVREEGRESSAGGGDSNLFLLALSFIHSPFSIFLPPQEPGVLWLQSQAGLVISC